MALASIYINWGFIGYVTLFFAILFVTAVINWYVRGDKDPDAESLMGAVLALYVTVMALVLCIALGGGVSRGPSIPKSEPGPPASAK